jgi:hypothetical protein
MRHALFLLRFQAPIGATSIRPIENSAASALRASARYLAKGLGWAELPGEHFNFAQYVA